MTQSFKDWWTSANISEGPYGENKAIARAAWYAAIDAAPQESLSRPGAGAGPAVAASSDKNSAQKPVAWRYRYGKKGSWRFCDSHEDCNESPNYEIEPLYAAPSAIAPHFEVVGFFKETDTGWEEVSDHHAGEDGVYFLYREVSSSDSRT